MCCSNSVRCTQCALVSPTDHLDVCMSQTRCSDVAVGDRKRMARQVRRWRMFCSPDLHSSSDL